MTSSGEEIKRPFNKPATTYTQQVELLLKRNMTIADSKKAEHYLRHLNYYRLRAYWLPFENNLDTHDFCVRTSFDRVLELYLFDRHLRILIIEAIEQIEVSVRSLWAYHMAHNHGSHAHLDGNIVTHTERWKFNLKKLNDEVERSEEVFIKHFAATYSEQLPPIWAVCEVMSLGLLSHWFAILKPMKTRKGIAATYNLDEGVLQSWLHHLSIVRNHCAHHSRLWNRLFSIIPAMPKNKCLPISSEWVASSRKLYNTLLIINHFMEIIDPNNTWKSRLMKLIKKYNIDVTHIGFPADWECKQFWKPCV